MNEESTMLDVTCQSIKDQYSELDRDKEYEAMRLLDGRFLRIRYRVDFTNNLIVWYEEGDLTDTDGLLSITADDRQQWVLSHETVNRAVICLWYEMKGNPGRQTLDYLLMRVRETNMLNDL